MSNLKTLFDKGAELKTKALMPWFGSNRILAPLVGQSLKGCKWVGVPFAGGMSELAHITARTIVVSDLHKHVINLALCVKCPDRRAQLVERLNRLTLFHPDVLFMAQTACRAEEQQQHSTACCVSGGVDWAYSYFISGWMGRSHKSGIDDEFNGGLSVRWNANGGDSNVRFRSAVESLDAWGEIVKRCNFVVQDVFEFLEKCEDRSGHGIYCDPPFPGPGDRYKYRFTEEQHRRLAARLSEFRETRVVCRFYEHPLVRELYPEPQWKWNQLKGRKQSNDEAHEVLITSDRAVVLSGLEDQP